MNQTVTKLTTDIVALHDIATTAVGNILFNAFGIPSTQALNILVLYVIVTLVCAILARTLRPAPKSRYRNDSYGIRFGRKS